MSSFLFKGVNMKLTTEKQLDYPFNCIVSSFKRDIGWDVHTLSTRMDQTNHNVSIGACMYKIRDGMTL